MRTRISFGVTVISAVTTALGVILVNVPLAEAAVTATLYASPTGTGTACTVAAPCSLSQAQTSVRALVPAMSGDIAVDLFGGVYALSGPLKLGPQDSGQNGHTVIYQAYPGQVPILSGASQVTGWTLYDTALNIYRAAAPAGAVSSQLFVNGVRAQRARTATGSGLDRSGSSFITSDPSFASFTNQAQVQVVDDDARKQLRCPLSSITATAAGGSSLNVLPSCFTANNSNVPNVGFPFNGAGLPTQSSVSWIENAYQLLKKPGQYYLDSGAGFLFYIPLAGQSMATADVELPTQRELLDLSGTPGHLAPVLYNAAGSSYTGSWTVSTNRSYGDLGNAVTSTTTNGDAASFTFTGTGLQVLGETNSDLGTADLYVDGVKIKSVSATSAGRVAQQVIASVSGLAKAQHTLKLVKTGGTYLLVNGYVVTPDVVSPVHNITFTGITFQYTTWTQPDASGYVDNQAGILWNPVDNSPTRTPAAIQVHRGNAISFAGDVVQHLGGTGLDLADGTQNSSVTGNWITDTSGGGVSVGEVDDYYLTDTALMTSGDIVNQNTISRVGQDYHDAVGVFVGYTTSAVISHNDIGYTPYSGMSLGWGWGWQSDCTLQANQGLSTCRHGSIYAANNQILNNYVHNVMGFLHDGGPIYTNGGQGSGTGVAGAPCQFTSVLAGNVLSEGNNTNNMLYQDEGSSCWNTYNNVIDFGGEQWVGMWTPTINNINIHETYSDNPNHYSNATASTVNQATIVTGGAWPAAATAIMTSAGVSSQYAPITGRVDDDNLAVSYAGNWSASANRGVGDYNDGVHATMTNGDSASLNFSGTGVTVLGETNSDQGSDEVYLDGVDKGSVNTSSASRGVQQAIYTVTGLAPGPHTVKVIKTSGTWTTLDGFEVTRTVNDTDSAVAYRGSWAHYQPRGYGDYTDDVTASTANGDSATVTFYGTGITYYTETNSDEGTVGVTLDGVAKNSVNANSASRQVGQALYSVTGLPVGRHTLVLTKLSGQYLLVDRFDIS